MTNKIKLTESFLCVNNFTICYSQTTTTTTTIVAVSIHQYNTVINIRCCRGSTPYSQSWTADVYFTVAQTNIHTNTVW